MATQVVDIVDLQEQCQRSIERSRRRRLAAEEWRRTRFRRHGGTASLATAGVLAAVGGIGAAAGPSDSSESHAAGDESASPSGEGPSTEGRVANIDVALDARLRDSTERKVRALTRMEARADGLGGVQNLAALVPPEPEPVEPRAEPAQPVAQRAARPQQPAAKPEPVRAAKRAPARPQSARVQKAPAPTSQGGGNVSPALQRIAQCESGGNPGAIGGGGAYRGKYQFSRDTWRSLGGSGDPAKAPEAEQDRRAAQLYSQSGPSQWPSCGR